jgi:3-methyladenine DNA glycosylase/8-oxoguanine DNA glycosylase
VSGGAPPDGQRTFTVRPPFDFDESLRFLPFGPHDPTCRRDSRQLWKAGRSPDGPVTLQLARAAEGIVARAWGPGAGWALRRADALAGLRDDPAGFEEPPGPIGTLARRARGLRLPRNPWVFDGLTKYVLQQRVTFRDAARAHRRLVRGLGTAAPGPPGLLLPLAPSDWLELDEGAFRRAGIDGRRARTLRSAARSARRVGATFDLEPVAARAILRSVPGCGPWTVGITMGFVLGDPDAVPVGDLHLPHEVGWALAAEPGADDARMLELLEPYRGHRFRVLRLLLAAGRVHMGATS